MNTESAKTGTVDRNSVANVFRKEQRGLLLRLLLLAVVVLVLGQFAVSWFSLVGFDREFDPQLHRKASAVGQSLSDQLSYAIADLEIPSQELVGVEDYFETILSANNDIEYLALIDASGSVLFVSGISMNEMSSIMASLSAQGVEQFHTGVEVEEHIDGSFVVDGGEQPDIVLHVGVSGDHIRSHLAEVFLEVATIVVICWLVTFEFLLFFMAARVEKPMENIQRTMANGVLGVFSTWMTIRSRDEVGQLIASFNRTLQNLRHRYNDFLFDVRETQDGQIDDEIAKKVSQVHQNIDKRFKFDQGEELKAQTADRIRVPLFLFIFSEELSRSFMPLFIQRYAPTDMVISAEVLIGLPITLFMVAAMIATPLGGGLVDRVGVRRVFLAGVTAAVIGFVGNFFTQSYYDLVAFRVLTGIGFGLVFIASESWVTQKAGRFSRASVTSVFVAAIFAGIICGPPIGGIFADRFGFETTFLLSASLAVISGLIIYQLFSGSEGSHEDRADSQSSRPNLILGVSGWLTLLKDLRFVSVLVFSAIPGRFMFAGFMAYLVPLYLDHLGHGQPSIGRIMMLYGIATLVCLSFAARFADRGENYANAVALGTAIAGFGCIASLFSDVAGDAAYLVILAIIALGVSHGFTLTSQASLIQQVAERHRNTLGRASVIGAYRLCERFGMVLGPMVAVALITAFGYKGAIVGFGVILLVLISLFVVIDKSLADRPYSSSEAGLANE